MKAVKLTIASIFSFSCLAYADSKENSNLEANAPTERTCASAIIDYNVDDPKSILKLFDKDNNGKISTQERELCIKFLGNHLAKDADKLKTAISFTKYWENIPTLMSFSPKGELLSTKNSYPVFANLPNANKAKTIDIYTNPNNRRIFIESAENFPPRFSEEEVLAKLKYESIYNIRKAHDANRDGKLDDEEIKELMFELRHKYDSAKSEGRRQKLVELYAQVLAELEKDEFTLSWGGNSTFKIYKDPITNKWFADEKSIFTDNFGKHASVNAVAMLQKKDPSQLLLAQFLNELQHISPFKRAQKIEEILPNYLLKEVPAKDSDAWLCAFKSLGYQNLDSLDLETFLEYIDEEHQNVIAPIFFTDPDNAIKLLVKLSEINLKDFSLEESKALETYQEKRSESAK